MSPTPPLPDNGLGKFAPATIPCEPGGPVEDASTLLATGEPCCSACRGVITVVDGQWVHKPKWVDLFGIDPDYTGGKPVREFLEESRGEA